jgi:hypothetical protein
MSTNRFYKTDDWGGTLEERVCARLVQQIVLSTVESPLDSAPESPDIDMDVWRDSCLWIRIPVCSRSPGGSLVLALNDHTAHNVHTGVRATQTLRLLTRRIGSSSVNTAYFIYT